RGVIVFAPASTGPLARVAEGGGAVSPATVLDTARKERAHRFPCFLPDGRHFLFVTLGGGGFADRLGALDEPTSVEVSKADGAALYAAPGHLMFSRAGTLMVQRFDEGHARLLGEPVVLGPAPGTSRYA